MGTIELNDGVSNRRIPVPGLTVSIRIELASPDGPRVIVPPDLTVERADPADVAPAPSR